MLYCTAIPTIPILFKSSILIDYMATAVSVARNEFLTQRSMKLLKEFDGSA